MLLSLWFACFLLGCRQAHGYKSFTLDGTIRTAVSVLSCSCTRCNNTRTAYVRIHGSSEYENVGFGKPVTSSSIASQYSRCAATNGIIDSACNICPVCLKTHSIDLLPWMEVDLMMVFTVTGFHLARSYTSWEGLGRQDREFFKGMDVLVDGRVVKQFPTYTASWSDIPGDIDIYINLNSPRTFRYIRIEKREEPNKANYYYLHICDVKIWVCRSGYYSKSTSDSCKPCPDFCTYFCDTYHGCSLVKYNVAIKKSATQGGTFRGDSNKIVDGIRSSGSPDASCVSIENEGATAWWRVDLIEVFKVYDIEVTPRVDCCGPDALKDFSLWVTLSDAMPSGDGQLCRRYTGDVATKVVIKVSCKTPLLGRYVWVTRKDALVFCELEAFGHRFLFLFRGSVCSNDCVYAGCGSNSACQNGLCKSTVLEDCTKDSDCAHSSICEAFRCRFDYLKSCGTSKGCVLGAFCDSDGFCKVRNGNRCREPIASCARNSICDAFKRCGIIPGLQCQRTDECSAGATCKEGTCRCTEHISKLINDRCEPVLGRITSRCSSNDECDFGECRNSMCTCIYPLFSSPSDFSCKREVTSACVRHEDCRSGLVCSSEKCYLQGGQNCFGNREYCVAGTVCVDDICSYQPGHSCTDMGELCVADSTCSSGICKLLLGKSCIKFPEHCQSGLCSVQDSNTCRIKTGQRCMAETAQLCQAGSFCQDQVCKLKLGEVCTENAQCLRGAICSQVQGSANKQCRFDLGNSCQEDGHCAAGSVCDLQECCRIPSGGKCTDHPDMCVHGSQCTSQGQCLCNKTVTDSSSRKCNPKAGQAGGSCNPPENSNVLPCYSAGAVCNGNFRCQCDDGFIPDHVTLQCRAAPGTVCSSGDRIPCAEGSVCDDNKCALDVGSSCRGENRAYCMIGTVCDTNNICRLDFKQGCEGNHASQCRTGTACDLVLICRRPLKGLCRETEDCVAGAECKQGLCDCTKGVTQRTGDQCVPLKGLVFSKCETNEDCTVAFVSCNTDSKRCECQKGYLVHPVSLTCANGFEMECSKDDECVPGMICDPVIKKCRIEQGHMCDKEKEEFCISETVCDFDHICRLDLKANCSGERSDYCKSGTFCDVVKQCATGIGGYCNETGLKDTCVAGAKCVKNLCTCDTDLSSEFGAICEPITGKIGGSCIEGGICKGTNSHCVDGICKCKPPFSPDRNFGCGADLLESSINPVLLNSILLSILALALAFFVGIAIKRFRHRVDARQKVLENRNQTLKQLNKLRANVDEVLLQNDSQYIETLTSQEESTTQDNTTQTESTGQSLESTTTGLEEETTV